MRILPTYRFAFSPMVERWKKPHLLGIEMVTPIRFHAGDKILVLRRVDRNGSWESLDDRRQCRVCGTAFIGRQVDVVGGTRASGPLRLLCPTEGCRSTPAEWVPADGSARARGGAPGNFQKVSVVRVVRKRSPGTKPRPASPIPNSADAPLSVSAVRRIVRLLHAPRARA